MPPAGERDAGRPRRRLRRVDAAGRRRTATIEVVLTPATLFETVTVTPTRTRAAARRRAGQRQRRRAGRHPAVAGRRRRRRAAAGADLQPVPAHQQPVVASDGAGRVAARHRPERRQPHAGAARRRAVQRSVRRLGVLDARAARERRSHRGRRRHRARASTATTRWAASSTS